MPYGFVKITNRAGFSGVSSTTVTFTGGNTNNNSTVIVVTQPNSTYRVPSVTDGEGNVYVRVVAQLSDKNPGLPSSHDWFVAPVTGGSGSNNIVTISFAGGTTSGLAFGLEFSGIQLVSPFLASATSPSNISGTSVSYAFNTSSAGLIITANERQSGGSNWSGLSGTDRSGVTNQTFEINDFLGVNGSNTITATCSSAAFGSTSILLALAGSAQRTLVGVGT